MSVNSGDPQRRFLALDALHRRHLSFLIPAPTRSGKVNELTCWRITSGWKSGLDSRAIC